MANRNLVIVVAVALVIGLLVGFSVAWMYQATKINALETQLAGLGSGPIVVESNQIRLTATVNGKFFTTPTFHGVVYEGGSNGNNSLFKAQATQQQYYDALISLGALPGNNVDANSIVNVTKAEGTIIDVYVTWAGAPKTYTLQEVLVGCVCDGTIKFGGNLAASKSYGTGCIVCLGTCMVGISSNSAYAFGVYPKFCGNSSVLPTDGTQVTIILAPRLS